MQVIITKYFPPTSTQPSKIKATCWRGSRICTYGFFESVGLQIGNEESHTRTALELCKGFVNENKKISGLTSFPENVGWNRAFVTGQLKSGEYVHVFLNADKMENFSRVLGKNVWCEKV